MIAAAALPVIPAALTVIPTALMTAGALLITSSDAFMIVHGAGTVAATVLTRYCSARWATLGDHRRRGDALTVAAALLQLAAPLLALAAPSLKPALLSLQLIAQLLTDSSDAWPIG